MSYFDYQFSQRISAEGYPYYALIMAAIRDGDTDNRELLREAFPEVWEEFWTRYNTPGGIHPMDGRMAQMIMKDLEADIEEIEDDN